MGASASRAGRPRATPIEVRSQGQRMLLERAEGPAELARLVGVDVQRIDAWRSGRARPRAASAHRMLEALGIPIDAWSVSVAPEPTPPPSAEPPPEAGPAAPPQSALEEIEELLAALRSAPPPLNERERVKMISERRALLALKARIEHRESLVEPAIVDAHPRWAEIREALRRGLAPYPEAFESVRRHLAAIGAWERAAGELDDDEGDEEASA